MIFLPTLELGMMKRNAGFFSLLALTFFHVYELHGAQVEFEGDVEYVRQRSCPSKSTLCGWGEGGRFTHQQQYRYFGHTDIFYIAQGVLSGSDTFDDRVRINYMEADGEFWLTYLYCSGNYQITSLLGYGVRLRWEKRVRPFTCRLETNVVYIPLGVRIDYSCNHHVSVGAQLKVDFMAYTWWRYIHPLLSTKFHQLKRRVGYEVKGWLGYDYSCQWTMKLIPSFRYLDLHYPEEIVWGPESRQLFYYGIKIGVDYHY